MNTGRSCFLLAAAVAAGSFAFGQNIISAKSGLIHYLDGRVLLDEQVLDTKLTTKFPDMKESSVLRTGEGRAEVLLTPGVFVRVGENSSLKMLDNRLASTRIELLNGSALVEVAELLSGNAIHLIYNDSTVSMPKKGLYRFDSDPAGLHVYDGEALVATGDQKIAVKEGRMLAFDGSSTVAKFDKEAGDPLHRWSSRRASYLSLASVSAAHSLHTLGTMWTSGGWRYNPYFGMFTYIPGNGFYRSPFGYSFWSPGAVYQAFYVPRLAYAGGGGGGGGGSRPYFDSNLGYTVNSRGGMASGGGYSGGSVSSAPAASAPAAASPRGGGGSVGRGSSGGGR